MSKRFDYEGRARQVREAWNEPRGPVSLVVLIEAAYPPGFWKDYARLQSGHPAALETGLQFLEADPFFFRTGYIKARIARYIRRYTLTAQQHRRLQAVVLQMVDRRHTREFGEYCRLAARVDDSTLRSHLEDRLQSSNAAIQQRAAWMLDYLRSGRGRR